MKNRRVGYGKVHGEPMKTICEWILRFGEIVKGMDAPGFGMEIDWDFVNQYRAT